MSDENGGARPAIDRPAAPPTVSDGSDTFEASRIIAKLRDPNALFTTSEVAYLMSRAGRWGYENRVDEENQRAAEEPRVLHFGRWYDQATERQLADAETRRLVAEAGGL